MGYLLNESTIVNIVHQLRKSNTKVVFTHGTFDLFHAGHSYFLTSSKKEGDILIVGVDSDEKVKAFKGIIRPVIPEQQRVEILLNHKAVDFVFIINKSSYNDEKYYVNLYKKLFPNKVTFGRNFKYKDQFNKKEYKIRGVTYTEIPKVFKNTPSTSAIIKKIKES